MTETGRSARETGRTELSGSVDPSPIPERIALAIDFLTPRVTSCFCRSDLALAGASLNRGSEYSRPRVCGDGLTERVRRPPIWPCLEQSCQHPQGMRREKGHIDGTRDHDSSSSVAVSEVTGRSLEHPTYVRQPEQAHLLCSRVLAH